MRHKTTKDNHSQCDWGEGHSEGFEAGVELERERIYKAVYDYFRLFDGYSNKTNKISEVELITLIREAQDD